MQGNKYYYMHARRGAISAACIVFIPGTINMKKQLNVPSIYYFVYRKYQFNNNVLYFQTLLSISKSFSVFLRFLSLAVRM